ncbi:MAG: hypothetical protein ACI8SE_000811 [Bacteroidia bacterium]
MSRVSLSNTGFFLPMRIVLILIISSLSLIAQAQHIQVSYVVHNFNQPGIAISAPQLWMNKVVDKTKKKGIKQTGKSNIILPQLTYYNHIRKENNFTLGVEIIRQRHRMKPANWKFETGLGIHYVKSFNAGKTFKVENGVVERIRFAGQNYFAPSVSYSIGRDFLKKRTNPISVYFKPQAFFLMPYNESIVPSINLQFGIRLHLNTQTNA